jgi:hypothetical protein
MNECLGKQLNWDVDSVMSVYKTILLSLIIVGNQLFCL